MMIYDDLINKKVMSMLQEVAIHIGLNRSKRWVAPEDQLIHFTQ